MLDGHHNGVVSNQQLARLASQQVWIQKPHVSNGNAKLEFLQHTGQMPDRSNPDKVTAVDKQCYTFSGVSGRD